MVKTFMSNLEIGFTKRMKTVVADVTGNVWIVVQVQQQSIVQLAKIYLIIPFVFKSVQYLSTMILVYANLVTKIA